MAEANLVRGGVHLEKIDPPHLRLKETTQFKGWTRGHGKQDNPLVKGCVGTYRSMLHERAIPRELSWSGRCTDNGQPIATIAPMEHYVPSPLNNNHY